MSVRFDAGRGLIVAPARVVGPHGQRVANLAVDTGATMTMLRTALLVRLGYDPGLAEDRVRVTTASGVEYVPRVSVGRFEALDETHEPFAVVAHTLPPSATVDGLLGLDFFRGRKLTRGLRSRDDPARVSLRSERCSTQGNRIRIARNPSDVQKRG